MLIAKYRRGSPEKAPPNLLSAADDLIFMLNNPVDQLEVALETACADLP